MSKASIGVNTLCRQEAIVRPYAEIWVGTTGFCAPFRLQTIKL